MLGTSRVLWAIAIANAALYALLLPLWEGFDEPFHYGYVQFLADHGAFPDARFTPLSREIADSLLLAPASESVKRNLPRVTTYSEFFSKDRQEQMQMRDALDRVNPSLRSSPSDILNYEAHQAPLAYLMLAPVDRVVRNIAIRIRVLLLRFLAAGAGAALLLSGMKRLGKELGMSDGFADAGCFCVLCCQMTWATMGHVANDWLSVPLSIWVLYWTLRYWRRRSAVDAVWLASVTAAGLLAKSYFLAIFLFAGIVVLVVRRWRNAVLFFVMAGLAAFPWYWRNLSLYGVLTSTQEARSGISARELATTALRMDWLLAPGRAARSALWTGNNTFMTYSKFTLNLLLAAIALGFIGWLVSAGNRSAKWIVAGFSTTYVVALAYATAVSYLFTRGAALEPSPWYSEVLVGPILCCCFLGFSGMGRWGRYVAMGTAGLFSFVLIATYLFKLIPYYGGVEAKATFGNLGDLYFRHLGILSSNLSLTSCGPVWAIVLLTVFLVFLCPFYVVRLARLL